MASVATRLACVSSRQTLLPSRCLLSVQPDRRRHRVVSRRRLPARAKTFQQRLDEISAKDSNLNRSVNIGFPLISSAEREHREQKKQHQTKKTRGKQEFIARHRQLKVDLKAVEERWKQEQGPYHIHSITEHYGLYNDLFGSAFFYNTTPMSICYDYDEEFVTPVYYGNKISPSEAAVAPFVDYESGGDTLWSLVMTSPDGHLQHNDKECLHWMVMNIRGSDVQGGETLCDYLQPFPVRGTGYLRYAFILFQQHTHLNFSGHLQLSDSKSLSERTFSTGDFYRKHQKEITPASICFFQSRWDSSVTSAFHDVLKMKEPSYGYIRPPEYFQEEEQKQLQDSFHWYLDFSVDENECVEEDDVQIQEFQQQENPLGVLIEGSVFPSILSPTQPVPSWMKLRMKNLRLPEHRWKSLNSEK